MKPKKEIEELKSKDAWDVVNEFDVPKDANIIGGRFVFALKNADVEQPIRKVRSVVHGHLCSADGFLVHKSATASSIAIRILIFIMMLLRFPLCTCDATQAYLKSRDKLVRASYVYPPP